MERMFLDNGFNLGVSVFDRDDPDFACVLCTRYVVRSNSWSKRGVRFKGDGIVVGDLASY